MARLHHSLPVLGAYLFLVSVAAGKTWFVGGNGADFSQIQPAIDAAADGDVIIVRPAGIYKSFTVTNKRLSIRTSADQKFKAEAASIVNVTADRAVHLGGVSLTAAFPYIYQPLLSIGNCAGEVAIENIQLNVAPYFDYEDVDFDTLLRVTKSANVSFTDLDLEGITLLHQGGPAPATCQINDSTVQLLNARITGHRGGHGFWLIGFRGGDALSIQNSSVLLTHPEITGGPGQDALYHNPDTCGAPGEGGDGLVVSCGEVIVTGDDTDFVAGGVGGAGLQHPTGPCCVDGTRGGIGLVVQCDAVSVAGPVVVRGGSGGACNGCNPCVAGPDGAPFTGNVSFLPTPYPLLDTTGNLKPGGTYGVTVRGEPDAVVLMLLSDRRGWIELADIGGAPWSVLPGRVFLVIAVGRIPAGGTLALPPLPLPDDPLLQGFAIANQAVVASPSQGSAFSNASTRIVGE